MEKIKLEQKSNKDQHENLVERVNLMMHSGKNGEAVDVVIEDNELRRSIVERINAGIYKAESIRDNDDKMAGIKVTNEKGELVFFEDVAKIFEFDDAFAELYMLEDAETNGQH